MISFRCHSKSYGYFKNIKNSAQYLLKILSNEHTLSEMTQTKECFQINNKQFKKYLEEFSLEIVKRTKYAKLKSSFHKY